MLENSNDKKQPRNSETKRTIILDCCNIVNELCKDKTQANDLFEDISHFFELRGHTVAYMLPTHKQFLKDRIQESTQMNMEKLLFTKYWESDDGHVSLDGASIFQIADEKEAVILSNDPFPIPKEYVLDVDMVERIRNTRVLRYDWIDQSIWLPMYPFGSEGLALDDVLTCS